ncbi:MAG: hypothetical protein IPK58_01185 [Acidobacteria bacterium]|nr:hypothetical protein [Acidobacteriota bacterium]
MHCRHFVLTVVFVFGLAIASAAQQTIFNVPSTDILPKGSVYLEYGVSFKPNDQDALKKFSAIVPRVVVGIGRNVEVGVNFLGNLQPGSGMKTIAPTVKWRFYNSERRGISAVAGNTFYFPVSNRTYRFGSYSFSQVSKTFRGAGTRVSAGGYVFTKNVVAEKASRGGGQFGIEQPINGKFGVMADWITGKHSMGYLTPGAYFRPTNRITGYVGYSLGNQNLKGGNHFVYAAVGMTFF